MTSYKTIQDVTYAYSIEGEGEPLVLLHGFTGTKETWNTVKKYISGRRFNILTIDLPGHGLTVAKRKVSMEQFAHHLKELTESLGLETFHLLGYSLGGRSALSYTMYYPETIRSLILESASPGLKTKSEREQRILQDKRLATMMTSKGIEHFVSYWENIPLFESQKRLPKEIRHEVRQERLSQLAIGLAQSLLGMGTGVQTPWWDSLPNIEFPVLLVVGSLDEKFKQINEEMVKNLAKGTLCIVNNAGHAVHLEQVEKFVKIVMEYIEKIANNSEH